MKRNLIVVGMAACVLGAVSGAQATDPVGMVLIPASSYQMGDSFNEGDSCELPVHTVTVSAFYMDRYEVTMALWEEVRTWAAANGYLFLFSATGESTHPVTTVMWHDVVKWCNARSQRDGRTPVYYTDAGLTQIYRSDLPFAPGLPVPFVKWSADGYRLPTEAEWEKAARGGVSARRFPWSNSDTIQHARANYQSLGYPDYDTSPTWGYHPSYTTGGLPNTSPAGSFAPNGYGLYDMAGNAKEWCWDRYDSTYYGSSPGTDPRGPTSGSERVIRGGSFDDYVDQCRVACRNREAGEYIGWANIGFRTVSNGGVANPSPTLSVTPDNSPVSSASGATTFTVSNTGGGTKAYTTSASVSWLRITGGGSGGNSGTITVSYDANPNTIPRTGTITVTALGAGGSPKNVTVTQAGAVIPAPVVPTQTSPSGAVTTTRRPVFKWSAVADATYYNVCVHCNGSTYADTWVAGATNWTPAADMPIGAHQWWIRGYGPGGCGNWSSQKEFTIVGNRPAVAPTQTAPSGTISNTRRPVFTWNAVANAAWYYVYVSRNGTKYADKWVQGVTWTVEPDLPAGSYQWWIMGWGPDGNGPWSGAKTFTIPLTVPAVLAPVAPSGTDLQGSTFRYRWNKTANAVWYHLLIQQDGAAWRDLWYPGTGTGEMGVDISTHRAGATYRWWVCGWSPDGAGPWSSAMQFTTLTDRPAKPVMTAPQGATANRRPTFQWNANARTDWYWIYVNRGTQKAMDKWVQSPTTTFTPTADLMSGAYTWWLGAWNAASGVTVWSDGVAFTITN